MEHYLAQVRTALRLRHVGRYLALAGTRKDKVHHAHRREQVLQASPHLGCVFTFQQIDDLLEHGVFLKQVFDARLRKEYLAVVLAVIYHREATAYHRCNQIV